LVTESTTLTHTQPTTVSSSSVLDLLDYCDTYGIEHNESPKLIRKHLLNPEERIDEVQVVSLWNAIAKHTDIPHVGLLIGQQINPSAKGLLASWISQCETLKEAITIFLQHIALMNPSEQWHMKTTNDITQLTFTLAVNKNYPIAAIERSMSALLSWGRELTGENIQPKYVTFKHSAPAHVEQYKRIFGEEIKFNEIENNLFFESRLFDLPIKSANSLLKKMIQIKAQESLGVLNENLTVSLKVASLIKANLASQTATIEHLSTLLSMSRQTLYRKLKHENTDFKTLLNDIRKARVLELLADEKTNILHISLQLGFKETSSFHKAFHRWYGMTPSAYIIKYKNI